MDDEEDEAPPVRTPATKRHRERSEELSLQTTAPLTAQEVHEEHQICEAHRRSQERSVQDAGPSDPPGGASGPGGP